MNRPSLISVLSATALSFMVLYLPQPLLPMLAHEFTVSDATSWLLMSVPMLPLGLAPILYGYLMQGIAVHLLLRASIAGLAISSFALALVPDFEAMLVLRIIQGLLLPAAFTSLMTYCSTAVPTKRVWRTMSYYIAASIVGGYLGRAVSGSIATFLDWRLTPLLIGAMLTLVVMGIWRLPVVAQEFQKPRLNVILEVLPQPIFARCYCIMALVFLGFVSVLNVLPFRLKALNPEISELAIALTYTGYLIGVWVSLSSVRISKRVGGEVNTIVLGLSIYLIAVICLLIPSTTWLYVNMVMLCTGMFLIHSTISGYLNQLAKTHQAMVNSLYVSFYYTSGAAGAYFPGLVYDTYGWIIYLNLIFLLALATAAVVFNLKRVVAHQPSHNC